MAPRLLYTNEQTPEMLSLKGTEEEFQAKVETTKTAASTKTASREEETWSANQRAMWQDRVGERS